MIYCHFLLIEWRFWIQAYWNRYVTESQLWYYQQTFTNWLYMDKPLGLKGGNGDEQGQLERRGIKLIYRVVNGYLLRLV